MIISSTYKTCKEGILLKLETKNLPGVLSADNIGLLVNRTHYHVCQGFVFADQVTSSIIVTICDSV